VYDANIIVGEKVTEIAEERAEDAVCVEVGCRPLNEEETECRLQEGGDDVDDCGNSEKRVERTQLGRVCELHCRWRRPVFFQ